MGAPQHSGLEEQQPRLPFPAKVLSVLVLVSAVRSAVDLATGVEFDPVAFTPRPLDTVTTAASILTVVLLVPSGVGFLLRRAQARRLLILAWFALYVTRLLVRLPTTVGQSMPPGFEFLRWLILWYLVGSQAIAAVLAASYLRSLPVRQATGESPATLDAPGLTPRDARRLPCVGKVLAVSVLDRGAGYGAFSAFLLAHSISSGFWGPGTSWFSLLSQPALARPLLQALMGVAGIVGGAVLLCRQSWGRWTVLVFLCLDALQMAACFLNLGGALHADRYAGMGHRVLWDSGVGVVLAVLPAVFLIGILCTRRVRDAMVARR